MRYPIFVVSGTGPLWFIQMLFLFSVLLVLLRKIDKQDRVWTFCGKINIVMIWLLVFLIWGAAQILNLPVLTTYRFGIYGTVYLIGYYILSHDEVQNSIEKMHRLMLIVAIILGIAFTIRYFGVSLFPPFLLFWMQAKVTDGKSRVCKKVWVANCAAQTFK